MVYELEDVFCRGTIGGDNGPSWVTGFVNLGKQVEPGYLRLAGRLEVSCMAIKQASAEHREYSCLYLFGIVGSQVLNEFEVVGGVTQLPFSFFDVIFLAEYNHCGSLIGRFDDSD